MDNEPSSPMMDVVPDSMDDESSSPPMEVVPDSMDDGPSSPPMDVVPDSLDDEPPFPSTDVVPDSMGDEPQKDIVPDSMDDEPPSPQIDVVSDGTVNEPHFPSMFVIPDNADDESSSSPVAVNVVPGDNIPIAQILSLFYDISRHRKKEKRIIKQLNKPSSTLALGPKGKLCSQNRDRLWVLLNKLMRRRNWADAGGVLAVLLQATSNERSLHDNHIKYSGAMEILVHIESGSAYSKDIDDIYNIWLKKNASRKNKPLKDKFVLFDAIISFLLEKNYDGARSAAIWQLVDMHQKETRDEMEYNFVVKSRANNVEDTNSSLKRFSETSVMNRKDNDDLERGMEKNQSQVQGMITNFDEMSGSEGYQKNTNTGLPDSLLFPIRWDPLNENIEDVLKELRRNYDYDDAVDYLRKALNYTPGVVEAIIPLVQILLLNDRVTEAFDELDKFSCASNVLFASRFKTHYFEWLGCNNVEQRCSSYEDILKKDPTCRHSIKKLIWLCQMGDYSPERLVEMIGLHLDAAFAEHDIWREFASCLLKVCQSKEDRTSTCLNKEIPAMCTKGMQGDTWDLRCRWWKNRHFNKKSLESEMAGGKLSLMAYKAACATQIYGPGFNYVVKVGAFMKEEDVPLFMVLDKYVQST